MLTGSHGALPNQIARVSRARPTITVHMKTRVFVMRLTGGAGSNILSSF